MIKITAGNNEVVILDHGESTIFHSFNERDALIAMLQAVIYAARYRSKEPIELWLDYPLGLITKF